MDADTHTMLLSRVVGILRDMHLNGDPEGHVARLAEVLLTVLLDLQPLSEEEFATRERQAIQEEPPRNRTVWQSVMEES